MIGVVKRVVRDRGFAFIAPDAGGDDIFVHSYAVRRSGLFFTELREGMRIIFDVLPDSRGRMRAANLRLA